MEDRRTALAVLVSIMVMIYYWQVVLAPSLPAPGAPQQQPQAPGSTDTASPKAAVPAAPAQQQSRTRTQLPHEPSRHPSPSEIKAAGKTVIKTDVAEVEIAHLGGRITSFRLTEYKETLENEEPLDLVATTPGGATPLLVSIGELNDDFVRYAPAEGSAKEGSIRVIDWSGRSQDQELSFSLSGVLEEGHTINKTFRFLPRSYQFSVDVTLNKPLPSGADIWLEWAEGSGASEGMRLNPKEIKALGIDENLETYTPDDIAPGVQQAGANRWVAITDNYFMAAVIPSRKDPNTLVGKELIGPQEVLFTKVRGEAAKGSFQFYVGPKDFGLLQKAGADLERAVDLGVFTVLAKPLLSLIRVFYSFLGNYGLAIIVLTLIIKLAFLPLTSASMKSMKAMQDLQPEIKALRERIDDPKQLNQEMMTLYKKRGVNPLGGCLPMLIQIPVFLGLYNALLKSIELRHSPFALWITDLSSPERLDVFGIGVPVMILIMGASMFVQQLTAPQIGDPTQRKVMLMMPVVFTVMFVIFPFPSGLVLYWLVNNIVSIVQQMYLRKESGSPLLATIVASVSIFCFGYILTIL